MDSRGTWRYQYVTKLKSGKWQGSYKALFEFQLRHEFRGSTWAPSTACLGSKSRKLAINEAYRAVDEAIKHVKGMMLMAF